MREFMRGLIDDAGTFPPEELPLEAAVDRHIAARLEAEAWILGRFVAGSTNVGRLAALSPFAWPVTVVIDHPLVHDGFAAARSAAESGRVLVESVEIPLARGKGASVASRLSDLATQLTGAGLGGLELFVEAPIGSLDGIDETAAEFAAAGREHGIALFAKVRCGGAAVPAPDALAAFIAVMSARRVPFKATAGLHHPVARVRAEGFSHGYLNVAGASVLAASGTIGRAEISEMLADTRTANFALDAATFRWKSFAAGAPSIAAAREQCFRSFGSCSLDEPIGDLAAMGFLERAVS
jgi:hypothetical protein